MLTDGVCTAGKGFGCSTLNRLMQRCRLNKVAGAVLRSREYSMQKCGYLLAGWQLRYCSRSFTTICASRPEQRTRVVNTRAFQAAADFEPADSVMMANIYDHYARESDRPATLRIVFNI